MEGALETRSDAAAREAGAKNRLLLVEDDPGLVELLKWHLEREAFEVTITPDGEEALMLAKERPPDVVLLDWMTPAGVVVGLLLSIPIVLLSMLGRRVHQADADPIGR